MSDSNQDISPLVESEKHLAGQLEEQFLKAKEEAVKKAQNNPHIDIIASFEKKLLIRMCMFIVVRDRQVWESGFKAGKEKK